MTKIKDCGFPWFQDCSIDYEWNGSKSTLTLFFPSSFQRRQSLYTGHIPDAYKSNIQFQYENYHLCASESCNICIIVLNLGYAMILPLSGAWEHKSNTSWLHPSANFALGPWLSFLNWALAHTKSLFKPLGETISKKSPTFWVLLFFFKIA